MKKMDFDMLEKELQKIDFELREMIKELASFRVV